MYRWSTGRVFLTTIVVRTLAPGEVWLVELNDVLDVTPGVYALRAALNTRRAPAIGGLLVVR